MDKIVLDYDLHRSVITSFYQDLYLNQRTEYIRKKISSLYAKIFFLLLLIILAMFMLDRGQMYFVIFPVALLIVWSVIGFTNQFPKLAWWWAKKSIGRLLYWDIENNGDGVDTIQYHVEFVLDSIDIIKKKTQSHYQWGEVIQVIYLEECIVIYLSETNCLCVPNNLDESLNELIRIKQISYDLKVIH